MDAMKEEHVITGLQVAVDLPPEHHESGDDVTKIIMGMFEDAPYDVEITLARADDLRVVVHVPMKTNPSHETSWLKQDHVVGALIKLRLQMTLGQ